MKRRLAMMTIVCFGGLRAMAGEYAFSEPSDDRWHYPFNFSGGARATASCFGSTGDPEYTTFNDRDGILLIGWRTHLQIPMGLPAASYGVDGVRIILTHLGAAPVAPNWTVDLTPDEWFHMDYPITDPDAGQPIELFGMGFGPTFTYANWTESSGYEGGNDTEFAPRDPYPFVYQGSTLTKLHIEDNVKDEFTPVPWAIGVPVGYTPGTQQVPFPVVFDVNLALSGENVRNYFREQLSGGRVLAAVTSLQVTSLQAATGYPTFYNKEGAAIDPAGAAPLLEITLNPTGDLNGDRRNDLMDFRGAWECGEGPGIVPSPSPPLDATKCFFLFDFDEDGDVDLMDIAELTIRFDS